MRPLALVAKSRGAGSFIRQTNVYMDWSWGESGVCHQVISGVGNKAADTKHHQYPMEVQSEYFWVFAESGVCIEPRSCKQVTGGYVAAVRAGDLVASRLSRQFSVAGVALDHTWSKIVT